MSAMQTIVQSADVRRGPPGGEALMACDGSPNALQRLEELDQPGLVLGRQLALAVGGKDAFIVPAVEQATPAGIEQPAGDAPFRGRLGTGGKTDGLLVVVAGRGVGGGDKVVVEAVG